MSVFFLVLTIVLLGTTIYFALKYQTLKKIDTGRCTGITGNSIIDE